MNRRALSSLMSTDLALVPVREAFLGVLPVVLATNVLLLLHAGLGRAGVDPALLIHLQKLQVLLQLCLPFFVAVSLAGVLAVVWRVDKVTNILVALFCGLVSVDIFRVGGPGQVGVLGCSLLTVVPVCYLSTMVFARLRHARLIRTSVAVNINPALRAALNAMPAALVTGLIFLAGRLLIEPCVQLADTLLRQAVPPFVPGSAREQLVLFKVISQSAWFFGVHGAYVGDAVFQWLHTSRPGQIGLPHKYFHDVFMNIGGSGSSLSLLAAMLLFSRHRPHRLLALASLPFVLFNVNELLIFGLPIAFNPVMFAPFLLVPIVGGVIGWVAQDAGLFQIVQTQVHWMTPPLLNAWWVSGGNVWAVLTQVVCVLVGIAIYAPFLRASGHRFSRREQLFRLLDDGTADYVDEVRRDVREQQFVAYETRERALHNEIATLIERLRRGRLVLFYQPKVAVASGAIVGVEALLRLEDEHGQIHPPSFLDAVRQSGLSVALDRKIVGLVMAQIRTWEARGWTPPPVAINVDREFLIDRVLVDELIRQARTVRTPIKVEVTEQTFIKDQPRMLGAVRHLREQGLTVSIDDFGAGYSSLGSLARVEADEVKLDREFVVSMAANQNKAVMTIQAVVRLCHDMGMQVLAEGVETRAEFDMLAQAGVDLVQGYLTGRPVSADALRAQWPPVQA